MTRYTCQTLGAAWQLVLLGVIPFQKNNFMQLHQKTYVGERLVIIIPRRYKTIFEKMLAIIGASTYRNALRGIEPIFF